MSKQIEAMKLALEGLEQFCETGAMLRPIEKRDALREALAAPSSIAGFAKKIESLIAERDSLKARLAEQPAQQEPSDLDVWKARALQAEAVIEKFMTPQAQPAREWVGLTEEEKTELRREHYPLPLLLMEATEAKLKEKNT